MTINDLFNNQTVRYRLGKAGDTCVDWSDWKNGDIYVQRRIADLPAKYRKRTRFWHAWDLITMTPVGQNWAEYGQDDYQGNGVFMAEEWCMEIEGMEP